MSDQDRRNEIHEELRGRAKAVEPNAVFPGEPTATGWLRVLIEEVIDVRLRLDVLEADAN